jgi:DNA-binding CsgD family transcriptional regulator
MARRNTRRRTTSGGGDAGPSDGVVPHLAIGDGAEIAAPPLADSAEIGRIAIAALSAALEAIPSPAFLLRQPNAVLHANSRGRSMLDSERDRVLAILRTVSPAPRGTARFPIESAPDHNLVVLHDLERDAQARLGTVSRRWGLTPRQSAVLELVAQGDSNRAVASRLGCSEKTVELHVSALLAKTRCTSRAQLVASFWTDIG